MIVTKTLPCSSSVIISSTLSVRGRSSDGGKRLANNRNIGTVFFDLYCYLMLSKHGSLSDSLLFKGPCKFLLTNIKLIYYIPILQTIYSYLQNKISELFTGWLTDF